jgi:thioredoxin 1
MRLHEFLSVMKEFNFKRVTTDEFNEQVIQRGINAVLKITTYWSGASHIVAPIIEELAEQFKGKIEFFVLDYDREKNISGHFQVSTLPTILFFRQGKLVDQLSGIFPKNILHEKLQSILQ